LKRANLHRKWTTIPKRVGVGAASQVFIRTGEQSGLQTRIATTESVSLWHADEKVTAFMELESMLRARRDCA